MLSLSDAIHSISTSQPQIVFPPNKPIWKPMRHILIITSHFLLFCSHLAGRISWELPPPSWPALIANTPRKSKSLETTEWSYIVAGLVTKCSNQIQETAVFSVLMDRLNVMENKIVSIVHHHPLWVTPTNSSQSDNHPQPSKLNSPPLKIKGLVALHSSILKNYVEQPKPVINFSSFSFRPSNSKLLQKIEQYWFLQKPA